VARSRLTDDYRARLNATLDKLTGTVAAGVSVIDVGVELLIRASGRPAGGNGATSPGGRAVEGSGWRDVRDLLAGAPVWSLLAITASGPGPEAAALATIRTMGELLTGFLGLPSALGSGTGVPAVLRALFSARMMRISMTSSASAQWELWPWDAEQGAAFAQAGELLGGESERVGDAQRVRLGFPDERGGALRDSALFRSTQGDVPGTTILAGYVEVPRLLIVTGVPEERRDRWAPVRAAGLVVGVSGSELTAVLRIIVN
jgi:hypothetical protein